MNTPMRHIMLDLETLGTKPGSVILSIGAVLFDPKTGELGETFYSVISTKDSLSYGLTVDPNTQAWWNTQSTEAKAVLTEAQAPEAKPLMTVLNDFKEWVQSNTVEKANRMVWGNGASFDVPLLQAAYEATALVPPWNYWGSMCYRTIKNLNKNTPAPKREGTHHNALDDAIYQAHHLMLLLNENPW